MLSSVLRSKRAIQVNVKIMRTFVRLRRMLASKLFEEIEKAKTEDEVQYQRATKEHEQQYADWKDGKVFAQWVLSGEVQAFAEAIQEFNPFSELSDLGSTNRFQVEDSQSVMAVFQVHGEQVIPRESKSVLKRGKLSVKKIPKRRFYELYQDYVSSCVLRLANELFALLPIGSVVITASDDLLNSQTGHLEDQAILSVAIPRKTFETLNLEKIDPSDSMKKFVHRMDFKKTSGFSPVERLSPGDIPL